MNKIAAYLDWRHHVLSLVPRDFGFCDRTTREHILWYLTAGAIDIECGGQRRMEAGSLIWIPPGHAHSVTICDRRRSFACYSFRFNTDMALPQQPLLLPAAQEYLPFIDALYRETCQGADSDVARCLALLYIIATQPAEAVDAGAGQRTLNAMQRQRLHQYVQRHIHLQLRPADLAQLLDLSPDYFSRLFKRSFGKSPSRWLMEQRIAIAVYQLEHSNAPIAHIAQSCSYSDQNIFSRQFRQIMGRSPTQHRRLLH